MERFAQHFANCSEAGFVTPDTGQRRLEEIFESLLVCSEEWESEVNRVMMAKLRAAPTSKQQICAASTSMPQIRPASSANPQQDH